MQKWLVAGLLLVVIVTPVASAEGWELIGQCRGDQTLTVDPTEKLDGRFRVFITNANTETVDAWVCVFDANGSKIHQFRADVAPLSTLVHEAAIPARDHFSVVRIADNQAGSSGLQFRISPQECVDSSASAHFNVVRMPTMWLMLLKSVETCSRTMGGEMSYRPGGEGNGALARNEGEPDTPASSVGVAPVAITIGTLLGLIALFFAKSPLSALFTRLQTPRVLEHPKRAQIMDAITQDPGVHVSALTERLGFSRRDADYHLEVLRNHRLVSQVHVDGKLACFPAGAEPTQQRLRARAAMRNDTVRELVEVVQRRPGLGLTELAEELHVPITIASKRVSRMRRLGIIDAQREGRRVRLNVAS